MLGRPRLLLARSMDSSVLTIFGRENYGLTLLDVRGPGSILLYNQSWQILDPVTSAVPTQDGQTLLVTSLDSHIRLMDMSTGKMLNDFTGHANNSYRCRACFGRAEDSVICGDEKGMVWAWDLLAVGLHLLCCTFFWFREGQTPWPQSSSESSFKSDHLDRAPSIWLKWNDNF